MAQQPRQYTGADYARAEKFMSYNVTPLAYSGVVRPDQVAGMKELAAKYRWIDLEKAGHLRPFRRRQRNAAAMFHYPEFFKVGISESGNHDNREYEDDWAEKWAGLLVKNADGTINYDSQANQKAAKNLKGHLLLAHGTMDENVPPNEMLLVVDELIKANKDSRVSRSRLF